MRKLSMLIMLVLLILQEAKAQNQKGDQNLGLSLSFYTGNGYYGYSTGGSGLQFYHSTSTGFTATPDYSYFIANKLDIGASVGYGGGTDTYSALADGTSTKQHYQNYYTSVYVRRYILYNNRIGIRTGPFIAYQFNSSSTVSTPDNGQSSPTSKNLHAGINADFVYYPSAKIGLAINVGSLFYANSKYNNPQQSSSSNSVNLQFLNSGLMLSAFYVFGK